MNTMEEQSSGAGRDQLVQTLSRQGQLWAVSCWVLTTSRNGVTTNSCIWGFGLGVGWGLGFLFCFFFLMLKWNFLCFMPFVPSVGTTELLRSLHLYSTLLIRPPPRYATFFSSSCSLSLPHTTDASTPWSSFWHSLKLMGTFL